MGGGGGMLLEDGCAVELVDLEDADEGSATLPEELLIGPMRCRCADGEVTGACVAARVGLIVLRWSNALNWVRHKAVRISVTGGDADDQGGAPAAASAGGA